MVEVTYILKGLIIGIVASMPIGPILMLVIQKSINDGRKAGFSCGLGATAVDTTCAIIAAFALSAIGDFIHNNESTIEIIGGIFIAVIGISMFRAKVAQDRRKKPYSPKNFVKAMTMGFCNPAAPAFMLAFFTIMKMDMSEQPLFVPILSILAVAAGSALYWYTISKLIARFGYKFNYKVLLIVNRIAGAGVFFFGIYLLAKGAGIL